MNEHNGQPILVLGASGKIGRRVAERLWERLLHAHIADRSAATGVWDA
jgi:uncharacterized protein YbjT (DUF2867 family)